MCARLAKTAVNPSRADPERKIDKHKREQMKCESERREKLRREIDNVQVQWQRQLKHPGDKNFQKIAKSTTRVKKSRKCRKPERIEEKMIGNER
jgi:hypothetical protein